MDQEAIMEVREATRRLRRPPVNPVHLRVPVESNGELAEEVPSGPVELTVEVTDGEGRPADWLDDGWWTTAIERWGEDTITVHIAPTPDALLHPLTLHQLEMLRRVAPRWRLVGHIFAESVNSESDVGLIAASPYDQVRFLDSSCSPQARSNGERPGPLVEEILGKIRREQAELGVTRPVLVRLPSSKPGGSA
jgi:hypothetical protein